MKGILGMLAALLLAVPAMAADIKNVRIWLAPDHTRLVFDLSGPVKHKVFSLDNPDRLVVDMADSRLQASLDRLGLEESPVSKLRHSRQSDGSQRIVLDLNSKVKPRSFTLAPNDQYGHRLVLDLLKTGADKPAAVAVTQPPAPVAAGTPGPLRDVVVAIDAGHGGEDPGALGPGGLREKDVVIAIAREVYRRLDATPGYKPVMVRTSDYYVSLRGRTKLARDHNADLFVSIHADAFKDSRANGASVWVISDRGATGEVGRWLAQKENSVDAIGGVVSLDDKDEVLAGVLLDMSMTFSMEGSRQVADRVHKNIGKFARMHKPYVEQAGFVVLKSPGIPSILVETGFISNPDEARKLKSRKYQNQMAEAIAEGVKDYFWHRPPAMTHLAHRKNGGQLAALSDRTHKVSRGDTLSVIAVRNGVSLSALRAANGLSSDKIRIGQVLKIPSS
ncbi:N-acetylmuramoyl-L-alanine amidase [Marinobacterium rhizophilum]|uniref:N-acetylmuramoyl-L-alanine amidase n=1 Tax=Marinobacterium rhizophilum TaxID=420402 RepID=A0ABY5HHE2_9GAMM|nr:N-acetylmuramoyl-L-alanine amidase [Marinobacterium rhizophilum]UTW11772.1 N-acetylmuramoyl-L-alanine amidase [Marinobacterium rhizophilum]